MKIVNLGLANVSNLLLKVLGCIFSCNNPIWQAEL